MMSYRLTCWMDTGAGGDSGWAYSLYDLSRRGEEDVGDRGTCISEGAVGRPGRNRPMPSVRAIRAAAGMTGRRDVEVVRSSVR